MPTKSDAMGRKVDAFFERLADGRWTVHWTYWTQLAADWREAGRPLPDIRGQKSFRSFRFLDHSVSLPMNSIHVMEHDTAQCCCTMFMWCLRVKKHDVDALPMFDEATAIPVLVRHVPDIMAVEVLFYARAMTFGAVLVASSAKRLARLLITPSAASARTTHHRLAWDKDKTPARVAARPIVDEHAARVTSVEGALEIMFDMPSSHATGFMTDVEHYLGSPASDSPYYDPAHEAVRRFKDPALRWKSRSPFITLCVRAEE